MFNIKEELKLIPSLPGVYIMKNSLDDIIYVGKAISLKNRVRQYFQSIRNKPPKERAMVMNIYSFDYIITDTEKEALILEANLIKKYRPKYNISLRDDKQYPYIKITINQKYPRVKKVRNKTKDKSLYFGPYTNVLAVNNLLDIIGDIYKLRTCNLNLEKAKRSDRPCLNYHIGRCLGPCFKDVDETEYRKMVDEIIGFLENKNNRIEKILEKKMIGAAQKHEYEMAAKYRDYIEYINIVIEKQKIDYRLELDQDIIGMARGINETCIQTFYMRNGKIIGREHYMLDNTEGLEKEEILSSFIKQYYLTASYIPKEIIVEENFGDIDIIEDWLSEKKGIKTKILIPKRGEKLDILNMVKRNAFEELKRSQEKTFVKKSNSDNALLQLAERLNLDKIPYRIEAYDISNTQGVNSVGSMVVFVDGKSSKKDYRKFKIKYIKGPDDYGSLKEVLERRFARGLKELELIKDKEIKMENFSVFPDLIMLDGGKGQVNIGLEVINKLDLNINVCGIVKDEYHNTRGIIYNNSEMKVDKKSELFKLISKIQDEAHRFAIGYHRELMNKNMIKSELDLISGVGNVRKIELLKKFESVDNIRKATYEDLLETPKITKGTALNIYKYFNSM